MVESFVEKLKRIKEQKRKQLSELQRASQNENNGDRSLASISMTSHANRTAPAGTKFLDSSNIVPSNPPVSSSVARPPRASNSTVLPPRAPISTSRRVFEEGDVEAARLREARQGDKENSHSLRKRSQSAHYESAKPVVAPVSLKLATSVPSLHDTITAKEGVVRLGKKSEDVAQQTLFEVYEAMDENTHELYAIKVVDLGDEEELRKAYLNEIRLLEDLQGTNHVIFMHDYEVRDSENLLYVVLEKGETDFCTYLLSRLKEESIDSSFIQFYWKEMLKCVKAIHDKKIVHSDLKPANFLLVKGHLKLIDFGIASSIPKNQTSVLKDFQMGTLSYMAPESLSFSCSDRAKYKLPLKSDVWSLGCILYNMVYGVLPFNHIKNQSMKIAAITNPSYKIEFDDCHDNDLLDTLESCLERDVEKRATIDQLLNHPYLTGSKTSPSSPVPSDLMKFVLELQENTPNTAMKKVKNLVSREKNAVAGQAKSSFSLDIVE